MTGATSKNPRSFSIWVRVPSLAADSALDHIWLYFDGDEPSLVNAVLDALEKTA